MGTLASALQPFAADLAAAPRVYVDANVPSGAVGFMRHQLGWDVLFVLEHDDLRRARDLEHFHRAMDLGRTIVTLDRDFCDDRRFPPEHSPGVIICWAPNESGLLKILREVDQTLLRPGLTPLPLKGRKVRL